MIGYYQELLNECISISEWKQEHKNMIVTLLRMQYRINNLKEKKKHEKNT